MMNDLKERIEAAHERIGRLKYRTPEWRVEWDEKRDLQAEYARLFGATRGWRLSRSPFTVRYLRTGRRRRYDLSRCFDPDLPELRVRLIDHPDYFRRPDRPYLPAAIVTHVYCTEDDLRAAAAEAQLDCEVLPWSWYYPGSTVAAVLTAPGG